MPRFKVDYPIADNLLPCPFCGAWLMYAEPVVYIHPIGKCILSGSNFAKGSIGQWNKRRPIVNNT